MKRREFFELIGLGTGFTLLKSTSQSLIKERTTSDKKIIIGSLDPWIEVNLNNIESNIEKLKKLVKVPLMAVIKANAYGHGLIEIGKFLESKGINWLMVGKLQEAISLRKNGIKCKILNFGAFSKMDCKEIIKWNISQCVFTDEVKSLNEIARKLSKKAKVHVHIDTGLGRVGVPYYKALDFIKKISVLPNIEIEGISTALTEEYEFDREQLKRFDEVCSLAYKNGIHLGLRHAASSDAILLHPKSYYDMVRPGITIYGYYPSDKTQIEDKLNLKPALKLKAKVIYVKELMPGESLSYHRKFIAKKKELIATIGTGYSDGYPPASANRGFVIIKGEKYPVIASVTANHMMVNLKHNKNIKIGDEVILINDKKKSGCTAYEVGKWCNISVYKLLISLNPLLPRKYIYKNEV
ncbi:alanine racemase [Candidatus Aminicenantes bacterium AC-708-M15]|jgi:alanine racemase|nr:alanine racemase [SCandidatus Aminicenantes bacterium Aminicenantia_JdfR_composite]MCP2597149.1 alanine racemase [Candidatus Aminicenantes bacterium AC-335-G13]MCP2604460.1 alanine racemase [Candidatus Aminicenantes bacterium AC-708-M15]